MIPAVCHRISTLFVSMMRRLGCRYLAFHGISHPVFLVENMALSCLSMNFLQCHHQALLPALFRGNSPFFLLKVHGFFHKP